MNIQEFSIEELEAELKNRKKQVPTMTQDPSWERLIAYVLGAIKEIVDTEYVPDDFKYYVFEIVMATSYGNEFGEWYNKYVR